MHKIVNGKKKNLTAQEVTERQLEDTNYIVENDVPRLKTPEELEADEAERQKVRDITNSEDERESALENNVVEVRPGVFIRTRLKDYAIFKELLADLEPGEVYPNFSQEYPRGTHNVYDLTREEIDFAFNQGKTQEIAIRQKHALKVKELIQNP